MENKIETMQQKRAKFALEALKNEEISKDLANFIVGTPTMLLSNGLGQTMAFLMAKKDKKERKFVFDVIKKYLYKNYEDYFTSQDDKDFMMQFHNIDFYKQIEMQNEILKMLEWLKRYARAFEKK
ncbi:type III-B CRISPR module-associated protein Cmr5 [bacterium]|nr:type III-B CRISPR module-associated protein Cmr5 [bacterium]MBP5592238.1 type III-B CRISPR module-associated protein Cmr5 [bacterium]